MSYRIFLGCIVLMYLCSCADNMRAPVALTQAELDALPERFINSLGVEMQLIRGGHFEMGSDKKPYGEAVGAHDGPRHPVFLSPYYISRSELTREQFRVFVDATGKGESIGDYVSNDYPWGGQDWLYLSGDEMFPIACADWYLCKEFCSWIGDKEHAAYRLPTEAEWEYMARAGTDTYFWWGKNLKKFMIKHRSSMSGAMPYSAHAPSGAYPANPWGFYQVYGNAAEWCEDRYRRGVKYAVGKVAIDPIKRSGDRRVIRGGGYWSMADAQHSYFRQGFDPRKPRGGIRLTLPVRAGFTLPKDAHLPDALPPKPTTSAITKEPVTYTLPITDTIDMEFIRVDPGTFTMGSPKDERGRGKFEGPQTEIIMEQPFYLARYEMTQEQWMALIIEANKQGGVPVTYDVRTKDENGKRVVRSSTSMYTFNEVDFASDERLIPIANVSTADLGRLVDYLTTRERAAGRLGINESYSFPTNHQWEYAARAGSQTVYHFGNDKNMLSHYAWFDVLGGPKPIGQKLPNAWGFYDMYGNVSEWAGDTFSKYPGGSVKESEYKHYGKGGSVIVRGGAWNSGAVGCRSAAKQGYYGRYNFVGVRLLRTISTEYTE